MKIKLLWIAFCLFSSSLMAQTFTLQKEYKLLTTANAVQYKNVYFLTLLQKRPEIRKLIQDDLVLNKLFENRKQKLNAALKNCNQEINCYTQAIKFSAEEISQVSNRFAELYKTSEFNKLVKEDLIPSGCYILYANLPSAQLLQKAWEQDAQSLNHTLSVYVEGQKPNYPKIDSISFNVKNPSYSELVNTNLLLSLTNNNHLFFEPTLQFALVALEINERNDAADHEPMATTVNREAITAIKKTNFNAYKYSILLVPGEGPEEEGVALSAGGMLRCRLAAEQYHKGLAPFIMVSGGRVHPFKTKYSEAYEMKVFLMKNLNIPESAILMEPHARHTTTNLRNAARLIFRYGVPFDKPGLIVTVKSQSFYISTVMLDRCVKELGYEPYRLGKRISDTALEFFPNTNSLQIDFDEPLDP